MVAIVATGYSARYLGPEGQVGLALEMSGVVGEMDIQFLGTEVISSLYLGALLLYSSGISPFLKGKSRSFNHEL